VGGVAKGTALGRGHVNFYTILKVLRQCLLVLLKVRLRQGDALGRQKIKFYDVDFVMSRGKKCPLSFQYILTI
jgi:hypothetical protein